jgi:transcriptional regulator with XRE-family HTH domain
MSSVARYLEVDEIIEFGLNLRRARHIAGLSQQRLADLSGVSQSVISRIERGKAPMVGLGRLLLLKRVLGAAWPFGECPHDHKCVWQALGPDLQRMHSAPLAANRSFYEPAYDRPSTVDSGSDVHEQDALPKGDRRPGEDRKSDAEANPTFPLSSFDAFDL